MSDLGSPSLTPRPVTNPDPSGRVVGRVSGATDNSTPQNHNSGTQSRGGGEDEAARAGHHDPAVTLATTFVQLQEGAILAAIITERDADARPLIAADGALYLLDAAPRVLSQLRGHGVMNVKIVAVDRVIAAEIITLDDVPTEIAIPATLSLLKVDPAARAPVATDDGSALPPPLTATYRPAATYIPRELSDNNEISRFVAVETPFSVPVPTAAPLVETMAPTIGRPFVTVLQPLDDSTPQEPEIVSATILRVVPTPRHAPDTPRDIPPAGTPQPSLVVKGIVIAAPMATPLSVDAPAPLVIATTIGTLPLPRDMTLAVDTVVEVAIFRPAHTATAPAAPLPPIAEIAVAPAMIAPAAPLPPQPLPLDDSLPDPLQPWPLMQAVVSALQSEPALAAAIGGKLPSAQQFLTPTTLLFLNLMGVRSPARLLLGPEGVEELITNGKRETLEKFAAGIERLKAIASDRAAGDWRPYVLPFQGERGIISVVMLVRQSGEDAAPDDAQDRRREGDGEDRPQRVTRFVFDLTIGKFGVTQIDGIIKGHSFNLALRSEHDLGQREEQELRALFRTALDHSGFSGDISFRGGLPFPVNSAAEWRRAAGHANTLSA